MVHNPKSCVIIGAGIAGLLAARVLQEHGLRVTVLDKGRGVGGRMATRRIGEATFDHGAQFFTARDPRFTAFVNTWLAAGAASEWCRGFSDPSGNAPADGHPRYRGAPGMTAVPKLLAQGLEVLLSHRVTSVEAGKSHWKVQTEQGATFTADALLLTAPVPQSLALLDAGGVQLSTEIRSSLERVRYDRCIALMAQPSTNALPVPGGMQLAGEPISWIADNQQKGISSVPAVTIHAGPAFSREHWEATDEEVASALLAAASRWVSASISEVQLHRWRYAKPSVLYPDAYLALNDGLPLAFAGDAFGAPRVEGAALSGLSAAEAILDALKERQNR